MLGRNRDHLTIQDVPVFSHMQLKARGASSTERALPSDALLVGQCAVFDFWDGVLIQSEGLERRVVLLQGCAK